MSAPDASASDAPTPSSPRRVQWPFRLLAALPLRVVHAIGAALGTLAFALAKRERRRLRENLAIAGYTDAAIERAARREAGKMLLELPWLWLRPHEQVLATIERVDGIEHVIDAHEAGRGVVFLTPHLGCFEIAARSAGSWRPITVMYRPPRQPSLAPLMEAGRARGDVRIVPANTRGATALRAALERGEWIGILPDQVPSRGDGQWATFFGRPALTMTLATRLVERTGARAILAVCERLPKGRGYRLRVVPLPPPREGEPAVQAMNRALEDAIRQCPEQYLWSYDRYKAPLGMEPPEEMKREPGSVGG